MKTNITLDKNVNLVMTLNWFSKSKRRVKREFTLQARLRILFQKP